MFGGPGDDLLVGKSGRDLLIGGLGADRIIGNADDDILIAGLAFFNAANVDAVMDLWLADEDATSRRSDVETYLADHLLVVSDDDDRDVLTGSSGTDWSFANLGGDGVQDRVTDLDDESFATDLEWILAPCSRRPPSLEKPPRSRGGSFTFHLPKPHSPSQEAPAFTRWESHLPPTQTPLPLSRSPRVHAEGVSPPTYPHPAHPLKKPPAFTRWESHLPPTQTPLHSADWWRRHWERSGILDVTVADALPDGWRFWRDWLRLVAPANEKEIRALETDVGRHFGYVRAVGCRRAEAQLFDPFMSAPAEYATKPLLRS